MKSSWVLISLQILLSLAWWSLALMSDYKTCGDPACERMMSRVQALKDHVAQDCRFLSFKKGDMIEVYHKLSGKKSDLWAGSIDKQFGYFPRDTVKTDEVFVDEKNEIKMETQQYDFYCIDEFGSIFESDSSEVDDLDDQINQDDQEIQDDYHDQDIHDVQEDQRAKSEQLGNSDFDDAASKSSQTNYNIKSKEATQATPKQDPEKSDNIRSSWIGSAVTGWFGGGEESHDGTQKEEEEKDVHAEESFKSRKLALDVDGNQLGEGKQALSWIGSELTNVFGIGKKASDEDREDSLKDRMENKENSPSTQPSSWLGMGIKDVLGFGGEDNPAKPEANDKNEGSISSITKDEPREPLDSTEDSGQGDKNVPYKAEQEISSLPEENVDHPADANTKSEDSGWYSNVYSRFTNLYGDAHDNDDDSVSKDDGGDSVLETQNTLGTEGQNTETGPQSIFSVNHLSSVFDGLKSQFQSNMETEVQSQEEKPPEQTDPGKEAFVEQKMYYDEENNGGDEINPSSTGDLISKMPLLPNEKLEKLISSSDDIRDDVQIRNKPKMPGPNLVDDVIQIEMKVESSKGQTGECQTDGKKEEDLFGGKVLPDGSTDNMAGVVDSVTLKQPKGLSEKRKLHEEPLEKVSEVLVGELTNTEPSVDSAQPNLPIDQSDNTQSVLNSGKADMLAEEPALNELAGTENLIENISDIPTDIMTAMGTNKDDAVHLEEEEKVDIFTTLEASESQNNDEISTQIHTKTEKDSSTAPSINANQHEQIHQIDPKTNEFGKYPDITNDEDTQSETDSTFNKTNKENVDKSEKSRHEANLDRQITETEHSQLAGEKESVDITQKEQQSSDTDKSSQQVKTKGEWKHEIVPDVSKNEYSTLEKTADATLSQAESQSKASQEKIPSKHSTATEHSSDVSSANENQSKNFTPNEKSGILSENESQKEFELSDTTLDSTKDFNPDKESPIIYKNNTSDEAKTLTREHVDPVSIPEVVSNFSLGRIEDFTTTVESNIISENKDQNLFEQGELNQNASKDAKIPDGEHVDHIGIAHTASDVTLGGTGDFVKDKKRDILSENESQKGLEQEEPIQNAGEEANTLPGEHGDRVSIAEDANKDHNAADISRDSAVDLTSDKKRDILSENESQKGLEQEEPIQNAGEEAKTLPGEHGDRVSIAENANKDHNAADISRDSAVDLTSDKKHDILSENESQKGLEQEEPIQNADEEANTLPGERGDCVSIAENANKDQNAADISRDSAVDLTSDKKRDILSENESQKGFEQEEPVQNITDDTSAIAHEHSDNYILAMGDITSENKHQNVFEQDELIQNASKEAKTLDGEHGAHVSVAEDGKDSTKDFPTDKESESLSGNESHKGTEQEEADQNITEDANALDHDSGIEIKVETSAANTIDEEKHDENLTSDDLITNNGDNVNVDQRQHEDLQTSTEFEGKLKQIFDTHVKSTSESQVSIPIHKDYPNLQAHLSKENIKDLLEVFGGHKLSWLEKTLGRDKNIDLKGQSQHNEDLSKLDDFELEYYLKIGAKHEEDDEMFAKVDALLSTLRKTLMPVVTNGNVDKVPDTSPDQSVDEGRKIPNDPEVPNSDPDPEKDDKTKVSSDTDNPDSLISVPKEQNQSEDAAEQNPVEEDKQRLDGDSAKSDKSGSHSEKHTGTEEFVEPKPTLNAEDLYRYAAFVGDVTSDTFTYIVQKSAHLKDVIYEVVQSLPDDIRPGPDLYGLPWEVVLVTTLLGLFTVLLFSCRFIQSIKSRLYASKERRMGQKVAELLEEKCKVLETLSECQHKFKKLETALQNGGDSAQASEKENLEVMSKKLEQSNAEMKSDIKRLVEELETQSKFRKQQEEQLAELEETLKNLEEDAKERKVQLEQDKTTLKIHEMNTERLQKKLVEAKEENVMLQESKAQLVQEAEGWGERLSELEEEMRMCERSHSSMVEDCTNKDERIKSLTDCLLKMKDWDSEEEGSVDGSSGATGSENGDASDIHQKQKLQKLIHAAKMSADLKAIEEDKDRVFAKLADELKAKEDLQEGIQQLQQEKESLVSDSSMFTSEIQKLQQKLQIMTEMYQENELKLHRMLTVEEKERLQKEEKLTKAGKKINLAAEELNTYRQRAKELEEELDRTSQAYRNQIASHEKKAHDNWLAARAADRDLSDVKRENSVLRQRLTDYQFKLELMEKEPYAREAPGRPVFRGERSPYGPSPLGRPASETRAFLSPPTLMDGPPRISPQFPMMPGGRVSRGVVEPPAGGLECDRSGPHSDSGSASPSWEKERRGPGPLPGPPPPDPGMLYRRPPPGPFPMGPPPPRPPPPEAYYGDKPDFLGNNSGPGENDSRDSLHSMHGDMRVPPDADMRLGPPPGHPMGLPPPVDPRDPHFPRRMPYGPPDYFPPRGPGVPPMGMRGPPPPGMFPRPPLPHPMAYPPMRPPPDGFLPGPPLRPPPPESFQPGPPPRPSPPGSEQPPEQPPSPHDVI